MKKLLSIFAILCICTTAAVAQSPCTGCPDFTDLTSPCVTAYTGSTGSLTSPFANIGLVNGRHGKITTDGLDPRTGNKLHFFPPEGGPVIKLGNEQVNYEAEALVYEFTPQIDKPILLLNFAVVLQDPDHPFINQPRFIVRVTDTNGDLLEDCTEYDVTSVATIPGFQRCMYNGEPVNWRDWTKMSIDLSKFVGQLIQVQFITYDCNQGAHFGYCYFTAECMPNTIEFAVDCEATSFTLEAPEGFAGYLWSNGETTDTATFTTNDVMDSQITCQVISDMGCECTLYAYVTTNSHVIDSVGNFTDVICEGETYTKHSFNLPPQEAGTHHYQIAVLNPVACEPYVNNLELEVIERYTHYKEAICYEKPFNNYNLWSGKIPEYPPTPGVYHDTVPTQGVPPLPNPPYCNFYDVLELVVSVDLETLAIQGDLSPCTGELVTYSFLGIGFETLTYSEWQLPANAVPKSSKYNTPQITLYFTDDTPGNVTFYGKNGCGDGDVTLNITPRQSYNIQYTEEICQGLVYSDSEFNLGVQNEFGYFVHSKHYQSINGCDSAITLGLNVLPLPVVHIEPIDTATCNPGDEVTLWALIDAEVYPDNQCPSPDPGSYPFLFHANCGYSYSWSATPSDISLTDATTGGITVTPNTTTTYTVTVTSNIGCSATATQIVVVGDGGTPVPINETICYGETYSAYGISIPNATPSDSKSYNGSITTSGCGNVPVTVNLTVLPEAKFIIKDTICSGETYSDDYGFYFELGGEGSYIDTIHFISHKGCDSLVIFNFTINPQKETFINDNICQYDTYNKNGFDTVQNFAGMQILTKTFETSEGCDSTVVVRLNVYPSPVNVVDFGIAPGYPGITNTFTNWSIYYDESGIAGWEWYLDGTLFATTKDASKILPEGEHTVTLKVKSINGCWDEVTKPITVTCPAVPTITVDETEIETCGLETVTIEGSFSGADKISIQTLNSFGRKARLTVNNDGTFIITYSPTIANVGNTIKIKLTATDSSLPCAVATETISITVKAKPRVRFKGECAE